MNQGNKGYIALMSAIVVSAILLVVTVTLSYTAFFARYNIIDNEYKERSVTLAESCVDMALLKLPNDPGYTGSSTVVIGSDSCTIRPLYASGSQIIIETRAGFQNAYTNLRIAATPATLAVTSWQEIPKF